MAARPAAAARRATSAGAYSPSDAVEWQCRSTRAVRPLRGGPGRLGGAQQLPQLPFGQLRQGRVGAAASERRVAGEAPLALGPRAVLEHQAELILAVDRRAP